MHHPDAWKPPVTGGVKLNFDGGALHEVGWGLGVVVRNAEEDVCMAGSHQGVAIWGQLLLRLRRAYGVFNLPSSMVGHVLKWKAIVFLQSRSCRHGLRTTSWVSLSTTF